MSKRVIFLIVFLLNWGAIWSYSYKESLKNSEIPSGFSQGVPFFFVFLEGFKETKPHCILSHFDKNQRFHKLRVLYFERPPYYMTTNSGPSGIVMDRVVKVFKMAKINVTYEVSSINRILNSFKRGEKNICSPGWFMSSKRRKFAKFSIAIYQNRPMVLLTRKNYDKLKKYHTLDDIFKDYTLTWGRIRSFSYTPYIDKLARKLKPPVVEIDGTQIDLIRMLYWERFSYMLISPEEINTLIKLSGFKRDEFMVLKLEDIKEGSKRYIMFSKDVPDNLIKIINKYILILGNSDFLLK